MIDPCACFSVKHRANSLPSSYLLVWDLCAHPRFKEPPCPRPPLPLPPSGPAHPLLQGALSLPAVDLHGGPGGEEGHPVFLQVRGDSSTQIAVHRCSWPSGLLLGWAGGAGLLAVGCMQLLLVACCLCPVTLVHLSCLQGRCGADKGRPQMRIQQVGKSVDMGSCPWSRGCLAWNRGGTQVLLTRKGPPHSLSLLQMYPPDDRQGG